MDKLFIIVERSKIIFSIEFRMLFCIFFELNDACFITLIFGKEFIYLFEFLILTTLLGPSPNSLRLFNIQGCNKATYPAIGYLNISHTFLVVFPNFGSNRPTYFDENGLDVIGCGILRSYLFFVLLFLLDVKLFEVGIIVDTIEVLV